MKDPASFDLQWVRLRSANLTANGLPCPLGAPESESTKCQRAAPNSTRRLLGRARLATAAVRPNMTNERQSSEVWRKVVLLSVYFEVAQAFTPRFIYMTSQPAFIQLRRTDSIHCSEWY